MAKRIWKYIAFILIIVFIGIFYLLGQAAGYKIGLAEGQDECRVTINRDLRENADNINRLVSDYMYNAAWDCQGKDVETHNTRSETEDMISENCTLVAIW